MVIRALTGILAIILTMSASLADTLKINPSHPQQYTVVKGDTLWDISGKFLENPWQWPELWKNNPQVKNPHLIYPGDTLYFSIVDGKPQLSLSRPGYAKLSPDIRESSLKEAISIIPADAIAQFLTSPRIVTAAEIDNAPYVIDFAGEHLIGGAGDRLYARAITHPQGLSYTVYRKGQPYVHPATNELLGYEAKYVADTTLENAGDPATLFINKSSSEIRIGDRLMVNNSEALSLNYFPRPPENNVQGNIISVLNGVSQIGLYNIVVIDLGARNGIKTGHVFDIYRSGRVVKDPYREKNMEHLVLLPDEIAGSLMVFRTFEKLSYALVMEANAAIHIFDKVTTP